MFSILIKFLISNLNVMYYQYCKIVTFFIKVTKDEMKLINKDETFKQINLIKLF